MFTPICRVLLFAAVITCGWATGIARAQPPDVPSSATRSFASLTGRLPVGDVVYVTDTKGATVKGKVAALTDDDVQVMVGRELRRVAAGEVRRIEWQRPDSLLNGLLIGAAVGAVPGVYYLAVDPNECTGLCPGEYGLIALGAVVGGVIDLAIKKRVTVYAAGVSSSRGRSITVSPIVAPDRQGVRIEVRF